MALCNGKREMEKRAPKLAEDSTVEYSGTL